MNNATPCRVISLISGIALAAPAAAFELDLEGSLGDDGFRRYVPPVSNPIFNETPYITTELRPIYLHNEIPESFPSQGGNIDVIAVGFRIAVTERLAIIGTKDGYADIDFDEALPDEAGFANIALGAKYALLSQPQEDRILTVGLRYEPATGDLETGGIQLQGGDSNGFIDVFVTGALGLGKLGLQGSIGANLALDNSHDTSRIHYSGHADYELLPRFLPFVEFNGFTTIDDAERTPFEFEGLDLVNFGAVNSDTAATFATGARYTLTEHLRIGAGYEVPITDEENSLIDWRVTTDIVISY
ncbi:MAG: hypothetical protein GWO02_11905 [Gammaproteobacteria bacterium]|nr:hypothetical protein [Gammaproteobacteria bacterium]